jgi:hypothetical protein
MRALLVPPFEQQINASRSNAEVAITFKYAVEHSWSTIKDG